MHIVPIVFVVLLLLILFIALIGWFASSSLQVQASRPPTMLRVLGGTEETGLPPQKCRPTTN